MRKLITFFIAVFIGISASFADITVTVDISNPALGWTQLAIFNGSRDNNAVNPIGSFVDSSDITNNGDGTYTYTFVGVDRIENLVFMDSDGTGWPAGGRGENLLIRRTDNTGPVMKSTCFVVNEEVVTADGGNVINVGMRTVSSLDCFDKDPKVFITVPDEVYENETITLEATSVDVDDPVYTYSVKTPNSVDFALLSSASYVPEDGTGIYTFRATVAESTDPLDILAESAEVSTTVNEVPPSNDIVVTVDVSATDWTQVSIWYWVGQSSGSFVKATSIGGGLYTYTFTGQEEVNIIFVDSDSSWPSESDYDYDTRLGKQTVNIENVGIGQHCFVVGAQEFPDNEHYAKRVVAEGTGCYSDDPVVILSAPEKVFIGNNITLSATSRNIDSPEYTYYVQTPESQEFAVLSGTTYTPDAGTGTYLFKVDVADASAPSVILATAQARTEVKDVPAPIQVSVDISNTDWTQVAIWYWTTGDGQFVVPELENGRYVYTFTDLEEVNIIFVNSDGLNWPQDIDENKGKQTVNIENIRASACFTVGAQAFPEDDNYGKRVVEYCNPLNIKEIGIADAILISNDQRIEMSVAGLANVEIYTVSGIQVIADTVDSRFSYPLSAGAYIVRINGEIYKVLVK